MNIVGKQETPSPLTSGRGDEKPGTAVELLGCGIGIIQAIRCFLMTTLASYALTSLLPKQFALINNIAISRNALTH